MQTRNSVNATLLAAIACLLIWNVIDTRPSTPTAVASDPTDTGTISVSGSSAIRVQPDRVVVIFGIEPKILDWGPELSPEVATVIPRAIKLIIKELLVQKPPHMSKTFTSLA